MGLDFGSALQQLRQAAGLTKAELAAAAHTTESHIGNVEAGRRGASPQLIVDLDRALGTTPLLATLAFEPGGPMHRRALLSTVSSLLATGMTAGSDALSLVIRSALTADDTGDYAPVVAEFERRLVAEPSNQFGADLLGQLMVWRQRPNSSDLIAATAQLAHIHGLWLGNQGRLGDARSWHISATTLADQTGDSALRALVRARTAVRGIYEGHSLRETVGRIDEALALSTQPSQGALEAYAARVHVAGLTENLADGRAAVAAMYDVADKLPAPTTPAGPHERAASFGNYLECRIGPIDSARRAHSFALAALRNVPLWLVDAKIYFGRALAKAGDVEIGADYALKAIRGYPHDVRVLGVGVRDLLSVVDYGYRSPVVDELRLYATTTPGPWETI